MPDKFNAEDVDALFRNEYFQNKLKRYLLRAPYTLVASIGALVGLGTLTAAIFWFSAKVNELNVKVGAGQQQIERLRIDTEAEKDKLQAAFDHAIVDLNAQVESVKDRRDSLISSAQLVGSAAQMAADSAVSTQNTLERQQTALTSQLGALEQRQKANQEAQDKITTAGRDITDRLKEIQEKSQLLAEAKDNADRANRSAAQLQQKVQDLSSFKTFEMVTLRSHAQKRVTLRQIQSADASPVGYTLEFQSHGLRKPVEISVTVSRDGAEGAGVLTYPEVTPHDPVKDRWPSFCLCGTPWMFQGENWVQSPVVRDFLTMRIVGRQDSCEVPRGLTRQECGNGSSPK